MADGSWWPMAPRKVLDGRKLLMAEKRVVLILGISSEENGEENGYLSPQEDFIYSAPGKNEEKT